MVKSGELDQYIGVYEVIQKLKEELLQPHVKRGKDLFELERAEVEIEFSVEKDAEGGVNFIISLGGRKRSERTHKVRLSLLPAPVQEPASPDEGNTPLDSPEGDPSGASHELPEASEVERRVLSHLRSLASATSEPERIRIIMQLSLELASFGVTVSPVAASMRARQIGGEDILLNPPEPHEDASP